MQQVATKTKRLLVSDTPETIESGSIIVFGFAVHGSVGTSIVRLQDNDGNDLAVVETGTFVFPDITVNIPFLAENGLRAVADDLATVNVFYSHVGV